MDIEKVKKLAKGAHEKRECFKFLGMVNANQPTPEKHEALTVAYETARAEMFEADAALWKESEEENKMSNISFEKKLCLLINQYSKENASNTPDFILAQYLSGCLDAFNIAIQQRENWYGRDPHGPTVTDNHSLEIA